MHTHNSAVEGVHTLDSPVGWGVEVHTLGVEVRTPLDIPWDCSAGSIPVVEHFLEADKPQASVVTLVL